MTDHLLDAEAVARLRERTRLAQQQNTGPVHGPSYGGSTVQLNLRVPSELKAAIQAAAHARSMTMAELVALAVHTLTNDKGSG